jgi:hypothetical protein
MYDFYRQDNYFAERPLSHAGWPGGRGACRAVRGASGALGVSFDSSAPWRGRGSEHRAGPRPVPYADCDGDGIVGWCSGDGKG